VYIILVDNAFDKARDYEINAKTEAANERNEVNDWF
jgi:hypothetical protein